MTVSPGDENKRLHPDHMRFLAEMGYRAAPPDHEDFLRGEGVEAEWTQYIEKADARRRANGEPSAAEQAWEESTKRYDADRRAKTLASWATYHRGMAARPRAKLSALVARHEEDAARYEAMYRGAA